MKTIFNNKGVDVAFSSKNTIKQKLFSRDLESGVACKILHSESDNVYIGQTSRYLKTRTSEHQRNIKP